MPCLEATVSFPPQTRPVHVPVLILMTTRGSAEEGVTKAGRPAPPMASGQRSGTARRCSFMTKS